MIDFAFRWNFLDFNLQCVSRSALLLAYMRRKQLSYRFRKYITILHAHREKIVKNLLEAGNYPEKLVKFS